MSDTLIQHADRARDWVVNRAAPVWFKHGVDWKQGGFYDALDPSTGLNCSTRKRLRTATRQIYVFSEATQMGFKEGAAAVEHGLSFLYTKARDPRGGYLSNFDLDCTARSTDQDTYDLAFVLFGLAHSYHLLNREREYDEALILLDHLNTRLRHPEVGFLEGAPHNEPRRQNPHMHLLEACLAWLPFDRSGRFGQLADELVSVFELHFLDKTRGAIGEYFDNSLSPSPDVRDVVEPGHLFEWIWLLAQYRKITGKPQSHTAQIYQFAHSFGRNPRTGLLYGELDGKGNAIDETVRLWPHAEWIRAEVALLEDSSPKNAAPLDLAAISLWRFLDAPPGLWLERHEASSGQFSQEPAPATSLYHIVGAFSALLDLAARHSDTTLRVTSDQRGALQRHPGK